MKFPSRPEYRTHACHAVNPIDTICQLVMVLIIGLAGNDGMLVKGGVPDSEPLYNMTSIPFLTPCIANSLYERSCVPTAQMVGGFPAPHPNSCAVSDK